MPESDVVIIAKMIPISSDEETNDNSDTSTQKTNKKIKVSNTGKNEINILFLISFLLVYLWVGVIVDAERQL